MRLGVEIATLFQRDLTRLGQQLEAFTGNEDALWKTVPGVTNAAGNLALHLEGNLREYAGRQLGGVAYQRQRALEFSACGVPLAELLARVEALKALVPGIIAGIDEARWESTFPDPMWGAPRQTGLMVTHLLGHLNYHLGQIDYLRRVLTGQGALQLAPLL